MPGGPLPKADVLAQLEAAVGAIQDRDPFRRYLDIVCRHWGLDTGARSVPSVARWSQERPLLQRLRARVPQVRARIIDGRERIAHTEHAPGPPDSPDGDHPTDR